MTTTTARPSGPPPMSTTPPAPPSSTRATSGSPTKPPSSSGVASAAGAVPPTAGAKATIELLAPVFEPPRIVLNAVEGWGKTTVAAYSSAKPLLVMCGNETGYRTLLGNRTVPRVHSAHVTTLPMLFDVLAQAAEADFESVCIDASGGMERLIHEEVCRRDFNGDFGEHGFMGFQRGYDVSVGDLLRVLVALDLIREKTGAAIWLLGHVKTIGIKNPLGADYDQFTGDTHPKTTQAALNKWADAIFVGKYKTLVDTTASGKNKSKGKGIGQGDRVIYVDESDAVKAKNRYFMDTNPLPIPDDPTQAAATIWAAIIKHASTAPAV